MVHSNIVQALAFPARWAPAADGQQPPPEGGGSPLCRWAGVAGDDGRSGREMGKIQESHGF